MPIGIVTSEIASAKTKKKNLKVCPKCDYKDYEPDGKFCRKCGQRLNFENE